MPQTIGSLPMGAKIRFGAYSVGNEAPHNIKWIKVNREDTTFITEFIEDFRAFDAREPESGDSYRRDYGNNRYSVSNIDAFLNSTGDQWYTPRHDTDMAPVGEWTRDNTPYEDHIGFLALFNEAELEAILPTEVPVALPSCDSDENYEMLTRKVFLPSLYNIFGRSVRNTAEGVRWDYFRNVSACATPTRQAVENTTLSGYTVSEEDAWYWWLRSPDADCSYDARYVSQGGDGDYADACLGVVGVRPALVLNPEILVSEVPDDEGYYNVILSVAELEDVCEEDFLTILMG